MKQKAYFLLFSAALGTGCVSHGQEEAKPETVVVTEEKAPAECPPSAAVAPLVTPSTESAPEKTSEQKAIVAAEDEHKENLDKNLSTEPTTEMTVTAPAEVSAISPTVDQPQPTDGLPDRAYDVRSMPALVDNSDVEKPHTYYVTQLLNVRSGPSSQSKITRHLPKGEKVQSFSREGIWVRISGQEYVSINYLSDKPL